MATRLDRLFLLLETGSTPLIRKSAAEQLGEVQKLHPHELPNLLTRVHAYLGNSNWDTRVAATQAVEAIIRYVPQWAPPLTNDSDREVKPKELSSRGRIYLRDFAVDKVLTNGLSLLASEGTEFDVDTHSENGDDKERLLQQRQMLNKRLGFDLAPGLGIDTGELFKDEDLVLETTASVPTHQQPVATLLDLQASAEGERNLSVRELQHEKRKAKLFARQLSESKLAPSNGSGSAEPPSKLRRTCSVVVDQADDSKVVVDNTLTSESVTVESTSWPFEMFSDKLMSDLFDVAWERRHGAAMVLREIVRAHGSGAGIDTHASASERDACHQLWLEDVAVRLLSVMAVDRFGDFVSDEVVAPVRESCAQTLGVVSKCMSADQVTSLVHILIQFVQQAMWEVHHAGLLGIKYILAARQDIVASLLPVVMPSVQSGFRDSDDDVRAVAAAALVPVVNYVVHLLADQVPHIIRNLWNCLLDLDDLTASTASIMTLLAALVSHPDVRVETLDIGASVTALVPRLWPFLCHNVSTVRKSALNTLHSLMARRGSSHASAEWCTSSLLADGLRQVFQRSLLEERDDFLDLIHQTWCVMVEGAPHHLLLAATLPYIGVWLSLAMQPARVPFDPSVMVHSCHASAAKAEGQGQASEWTKRDYIGGLSPSSDTDHSDRLFKARHLAARCLGQLFATLTTSVPAESQQTNGGSSSSGGVSESVVLESLCAVLLFHLNSMSATQRLTAALVVSEWATRQQSSAAACRCSKSVIERLHACLSDIVCYDEVSLLYATMQTECRNFLAGLNQFNVDVSDVVPAGSLLSTEQAQRLTGEVYDAVRSRLPQRSAALMDERRTALQATVNHTISEFEAFNLRVQTSVACAVVSLASLPDKFNPLIRPLMDAVRKEQIFTLQRLACAAVAQLVSLCEGRTPNPMPKVVKNLCAMLSTAADAAKLISTSATPPGGDNCSAASDTSEEATACTATSGVLTLDRQQSSVVLSKSGRGRKAAKAVSTSTNDVATDTARPDDEDQKNGDVQQRGARLALVLVVHHCGDRLLGLLPSLWDTLSQPLTDYGQVTGDESGVEAALASLQLLEVTAPAFSATFFSQLTGLLPGLLHCLTLPHTVVRHMAARCIATMSSVVVTDTMAFVYERVLPLLGVTESCTSRQGAIECIANVVAELGVGVLPYVVLLIVPILGRMSDQDDSVRLTATQCFADLIRLLPLESAVSDTAVLNETMSKQRETERKFLEQLLDGSKIDNYKIPVPVSAELRKYQQDGVNWLAFLNKYHLSGILCDDMGLGKTLQTLCMLLGDHATRQLKFESTGQVDCAPLPSLVICPPTLTGHWVYEVDKFVSRQHLNILQYAGPPTERNKLQKQVDKYNVVVASYDVVRNDIAFFGGIKWNYCILDEGHVIRNGKTKVAKCIKQLVSNHRLILSGTPIQNNVLDLWSLFDFLMPGFLGTEKQFQARYGRPILQSRDAKSSSAQQEAGALAMESLHRQVLPFILRRLKEDVLHDLPPKIIQDYYCDLSPLQVQLYEDFAKSRAMKTVDEDVHTAEEEEEEKLVISGTSHIFQALQYLRKLCNHPALVLNSKHPQYTRVTEELANKQTSLHDISHAPKLAALKQLLVDCGMGGSSSSTGAGAGNTSNSTPGTGVEPVVSEHRALVFCQLKGMLDIIERDLLKSQMPGVTYLRLDGSVPAGSRQNLVNRFNDDPSIDLLLLTTHVGGLGLNLTGADTVIFVEHDWNPMKDLQAMDRAHRIGQKKVVNVYRLITKGTLEEKIMGLHKFKLSIANTVITQENTSLATMGTDQLLDLFTLSAQQQKGDDAATRGRGGRKGGAAADERKGGGLKAVLEGMEELWDERQYENEYSMNVFLQTLAK